MSKEVDAAVELLKAAIRRDQYPITVTSFMGLTPLQISYLIDFYRIRTGKRPEDL